MGVILERFPRQTSLAAWCRYGPGDAVRGVRAGAPQRPIRRQLRGSAVRSVASHRAADTRIRYADIRPALGSSRWQPFIDEASRQFAIPEPWICAVMGQESAGRTTLNGRPITSSAGAMGLMQVMPGTYSDLRNRYALGDDSYDPHDNILAGTAYLRQMYERYGYPSLFAAYNAGPKRFDAYLFAGKPLPNATLHYVESILPGVGTALAGTSGGITNARNPGSFSSARGGKIAPPHALFFTHLAARNQRRNRPTNSVGFVKSAEEFIRDLCRIPADLRTVRGTDSSSRCLPVCNRSSVGERRGA